MSKRPRVHKWTDEDAAYAAAQWASGISMTVIGHTFGYTSGSVINRRILGFIEKYVPETALPPIPAWAEEFSRVWKNGVPYARPAIRNDPVLVKSALAAFVAARNEREAS
jgi:hypothetical protein